MYHWVEAETSERPVGESMGSEVERGMMGASLSRVRAEKQEADLEDHTQVFHEDAPGSHPLDW